MMPDFSTTNILSLVAQEFIIASVGVILPVVLRIRHPRTQVFYCHALLAICLALPFAQPWHRTSVGSRMPATTTEAALDTGGVMRPDEQASFLSQPVAQGSRIPSQAFPRARVIVWILGAGVLARLLWLLIGLWKIRTYRIGASPLYPVPEPLKAAASLTQTDALFCISADTPGPVTMGLLCPVVLLPDAFREFGEEAQCGIGCHELLHVRRNDWLVTLIEEFAGALLWFNPAVWWVLAQARLAREQFVDAEAVRLTAAREPYIDALLSFARGRRVLDLAPAPLFLRRRHLTQRMHSLLKEVPISKLRLVSSYATIAAVVTFAGWFALESFPLMARPQIVSTGAPQPAHHARQAPLPFAAVPSAAAARRPEMLLSAAAAEAAQATPQSSSTAPCQPEAYVPNLMPLFRPDAALPESAYSLFGNEGRYVATVPVLVTVDPQGSVISAEALGGLEALRKTAIDAARRFKYQPVLRHGQPVCSYTDANVIFQTPGRPLVPPASADQLEAYSRRRALSAQWPRSPEQVFADAQQDLDTPGGIRRTLALPRLAKLALAAGALEKAAAYANESLTSGRAEGQAIFECNMVLGELALRNGDIAEAKQRLIASGKTPGSPALGSFGPGMMLANDLLQKGERDTVLEFFALCGTFWTSGSQKLASWADTVRNGGVPNFGANLAY